MDLITRRDRSGLSSRIRPIEGLPLWSAGKTEAHLQIARIKFDGYFNGTLNIDIRPYIFQLIKPEFTFYDVEWTDLHPPEHFSFSRCKVVYKDIEYEGWVYYPHPETKHRNFQNPLLMEIIAHPISEIQYEDKVQVLVNPDEVVVSNPL